MPGRRMPRSLYRHLDTEAASGIVLMAAALVALAWANSPWSGAYRTLWETDLSVGLGRTVLVLDLRHWLNDGLMALFFLVVGLEIKCELVQGDLRDPRTAALPAIAALGGMVVPAALFVVVAYWSGGARGWGIPMATDIAFALGVVAVIGARVPPSLRLFLLTLAIVDDIGAVIVIAVLYAHDVEPGYIAVAAALITVMLGLRRAGVVAIAPFVVLGIGVWVATEASGVHATIAGVVLGLLTPAQPRTAASVAGRGAAAQRKDRGAAELKDLTRRDGTPVSTAERLEHLLDPWVSFVVAPLFALANAGVSIQASSFSVPGATAVTVGVGLGLVVGKVLGITAAVWLAVRSGLGRLPEEVTWPMIVGIGAIAGIGFTVSLFVAELAFDTAALRDAAKIGILGASAVAAALGAAILLLACPRRPGDGRR